MNEIIEKESIKNKIYEIRGVQVMLDRDLAELYHVETRVFNQMVKRNSKRFPENFMFRLTIEEYDKIRKNTYMSSQNVMTYELKRPKGALPYVFTEQGVSMLAGLLKSDVAIKISIKIVNEFVAMRKYLNSNLIDQNKMLINHENRIEILEAFASEHKEKTNKIYYKGEGYDAYSKVLDIFNEARKELVIIDAYSDKKTLDIIRNIKCKVILIVKTKSLLSKGEIEKYNEQYNNLKIIYNDTYHDRYFVIDRNKLYHCGTSINRIGSKTFSINILDDKEVKEDFINRLSKIMIK